MEGARDRRCIAGGRDLGRARRSRRGEERGVGAAVAEDEETTEGIEGEGGCGGEESGTSQAGQRGSGLGFGCG
jgi:hypothetical protein